MILSQWSYIHKLHTNKELSKSIIFSIFGIFIKNQITLRWTELFNPQYDYEYSCDNNSMIIFPGWVEHGCGRSKPEVILILEEGSRW